jgi:ribosome-associated toxin RatA of RatAB toxin-antitoxin module
MKEILRSALVPFSSEQMFALVDDIPAYPEFLPYCVGSEEFERSDGSVVARLELRRARVRQGFTTRNTLTRPDRIEMALVEGPFETFSGVWTFRALDERACKVTLDLRFAYAGTMARIAGATLLADSGDQLVDAFCERARRVFGSGA